MLFRSDLEPTPAAQAALAQSFASGRGQAQAIAEMCLIAGQSQRTAEFLAAGFSEAQVRRALLDARADQPDPDTDTKAIMVPSDSVPFSSN